MKQTVLPINQNVLDPDFGSIINVTLSVLLTLKLNLVGVIYDDSSARYVSTLVPRLSDLSVKVVMYSANDVIDTDTEVMKSYLNMMRGRSTRTVSLVISNDVNRTVDIFNSFSRFKTLIGPQSGIGQYTKWLTPLPCGAIKPVQKEVSNFYNVAIIVPELSFNKSRSNYSVKHLIKTLIVTPNGRQFETVGTSKGGSLNLHSPIFPNINRGFNGEHFRVGVNMWYPFTTRRQIGNKTVYVGFCVDLVLELSRRLNFTFTLMEPADEMWGSILPDGNWTGLVGMLQNFEADITVAPIITTLERETVMDGTFPFYYDNVGVMYKRPDPKESLWKTYFHPFKYEVYLCIIGSLVGGAIIYIVLWVGSPANRQGNGTSVRKALSDSSFEAGYYLTSSLINHGQPTLPNFGPGRMFLSFWWIFAIILAGIYKGNLTAFLLVAKDDLPFSTLGELANQDVYKWGVTGSSVVEYLFNISSRSEFRKIGEGLERFKATDNDINSLDAQVHLAKVKQGQYAYISDMVPMEIWMAEDCDLRVLKETVIPLPFVVGLQNNSAYISAFNQQLLDIDQMGLYSVWKNKWWPKGGSCHIESIANLKVISLLEAQSAFYVLCVGITLAFSFLIFECIWNSQKCMFNRWAIYSFWKKPDIRCGL